MSQNTNLSYRIIKGLAFVMMLLVICVLYYLTKTKTQQNFVSPPPENYITYTGDAPQASDSNQDKGKQMRKPEKKDQDSSVIVNLDSMRRSIMKQCLKATEDIARKSSVEEAIQVAEFLKKNLTLARPDGGAISSIDSVSKPFLGFVVTLPKDEMPSGKWKKTVDSVDGINYFPIPNNCIVVDENNLTSETIKGLMLLLCGSYSRAADKSRYTDSWFYHNEDRKAHEIINKVLLKIGGEKYERLLKNEIIRLEDIRDSSNYPIWPGRIQYSNELNELFSATTSLEIDFIRRLFWIHAIFAMIEKPQTVSNQAKDFEKIDFLDFPYLRKW